MNKITTLKTQAKHLVRALAKQGTTLSLAQALEGVAAQYGFNNWDTLVGVTKAEEKAETARTPTLADIDFLPERIWVEQGLKRVNCDVQHYDQEGLPLLYDLDALEAYFDRDPAFYGERLDTLALSLAADRRDYDFTFRDLIGVTFKMLGGKPTWYAPKVSTYFEIQDWLPPEPQSALVIPALEKSALGTSLIVVPSTDGFEYDAHVIVPAHLDVKAIAAKLSAELLRLKKVDRENAALGKDDEYTEEDLVAFVAKLGCNWVANPVVADETWD